MMSRRASNTLPFIFTYCRYFWQRCWGQDLLPVEMKCEVVSPNT